MTADVHVSTTGADDAEAIAGALEQIAESIRRAGGNPVREYGVLDVKHSYGVQGVDFQVTAEA